MPKTKVFAVRPDRLGGRLSAIVNAKRLADMFDLDLQVFWSKPKHAYPELVMPEAIFSKDFIDAHFLPEDTAKGSLKFTPIQKKSTPTTKATFGAHITKGEAFGFVTREGAVALPFEDKDTARVGFAQAFQALDFSQPFRATMDHINGAVGGAREYIAVHIRRGDVIRNENTSEGFWHGQYVPDAIYFQVLDGLVAPDVRFVLFCDDAAVLATYQARYKDAQTARDIIDCHDQPALHIDLAEMYLMSKCTRILGPRSSAFSMTAADLSATKCEPVEDLLTPTQMCDAISQLSRDIKTGVSAFHSVGDFKQAINALMKYHEHVAPEITVVEIAQSAKVHGISTTHLLENTLLYSLKTRDLTHVAWLETMVTSYPILHASALGNSFAALAYAHVVQGDFSRALRHLDWANWYYPESLFVSYLTSALIGENELQLPCLGGARYAHLDAKSILPPQKEFRFLHHGPVRNKIDRVNHMKNHIAPFLVADWLEFVNPKARQRLQMRTSLPRNLNVTLPAELSAFHTALQTGATSAIAILEKAAKRGDPMALKRLATAYFRIDENDRGLGVLKNAMQESGEKPAYVAALGVRLLEFGHAANAVEMFDQLGAQKLDWAHNSPAITYAHARALSQTKDYAKSADVIQRNLDFSNSCLLSNRLKHQLQKYF